MSHKIAILAALAVCALAACSSAQPVSQPAIPALLQPDKNCGSTHGVKVAPCPIRLTRHTKSGIIVTVSGPGVTSSYLGELNACFSGKLCYYAERVGSSETEWLFTSGKACGGADVELYGVNASGQKIGYAFLKLTNRYCP